MYQPLHWFALVLVGKTIFCLKLETGYEQTLGYVLVLIKLAYCSSEDFTSRCL